MSIHMAFHIKKPLNAFDYSKNCYQCSESIKNHARCDNCSILIHSDAYKGIFCKEDCYHRYLKRYKKEPIVKEEIGVFIVVNPPFPNLFKDIAETDLNSTPLENGLIGDLALDEEGEPLIKLYTTDKDER